MGCFDILKCLRCRLLLLLFLPVSTVPALSQQVAVKTNLLYWMTTTPNVGAEWRLYPHYSLSATVGYNAFNFGQHKNANGIALNPKFHNWVAMPELKYWFCYAFSKSYVGLHAFYGQYNVGGIGFIHALKDRRYDGWLAGAGISYGYEWQLGKRWALDTSVGLGYAYLEYDKYNCGACGRKYGSYHKHLFLPTKASVSVVYYIR